MKTFKQFLMEAKADLPPKEILRDFHININIVADIATKEYNSWSRMIDAINNGKFKDESYFKDADKALKDAEAVIKKYPYGTSYSVSEFNLMKSDYEKAKEDYVIDARFANIVKKGEKQEQAIQKLVKASQNKLFQKRFDPVTEEEILYEIEKFKGTVKLRGANDLYVQFKNGKVESCYY